MKTKESRTLRSEDISHIVDAIRSEALGNHADRKEVIRITLLLEEALLNVRNEVGENVRVLLLLEGSARRVRFRIHIASAAVNPFLEDETAEVMQRLLSGQSLALQWSFRNGYNTLSYTFRPVQNSRMLFGLLAAFLSAVALFLVCRLLPDNISQVIGREIILPLHDTFTGLISFAAVPLVLFSVMWGVYSLGDVTSLSNIGKRMVSRLLLVTLLSAGLVTAVLLPFYPIRGGGTEGIAFGELYALILDIIPDNFISPFLTGNTLQILFIAVVFGIALLLLSEKTAIAAGFVEQMNSVNQLIMKAISRLIPVFVFISIFRLLLDGGLSMLTGSYLLLLTLFLGCALLFFLFAVIVSVRQHVPLGRLLVKMMPCFLIGLTTGSSAAAFQENEESCRLKLGIDPRISGIGVPLGQTIFMPGTVALFCCLALYLSGHYGITVTPVWLLKLVVVSSILGIATPPVPGGALAGFSIIASQMGFPPEAAAIFCTLGILPEFLSTAINVSTLQLQLIGLSAGLDMLDKEVLRRKQ